VSVRLLDLHNFAAFLVEDLSNFGQEFLPFLVKGCTFIEVAFVRVELFNDLLDATQSIVDFGIVCHG